MATRVHDHISEPMIFPSAQKNGLADPTVQISVSSGVITTYSAILLANIGFSPERAALLNCPSGAVSIVTALIAGFGTRYAANRWAWVVSAFLGRLSQEQERWLI